MNLFGTSILNGLAVVAKAGTLLVVNKVLAITVGPSGYMIIGQYQNAVQLLSAVVSGAISNGVVKYTAEYRQSPNLLGSLLRSATIFCVVLSLIVGLIAIMFRNPIAVLIFGTSEFASVFIWFGATLLFCSANSLLLSVLSGQKQIKVYVIANICGSMLFAAVTIVLVIRQGVMGALIALSVYQALSFVVTVALCSRQTWMKYTNFIGAGSLGHMGRLAHFALLSSITAVSGPVTYMFVRSFLESRFGSDVAGFWDASMRLSSAYLILVTTTMGVYYLPRMSELREVRALRNEIGKGYLHLIPVVIVAAGAIYVCRDFIILALFSGRFLPMRDLFGWQLTGDVLRIGGWLLSYVLVGKAMTGPLVVAECLYAAMFTASTRFFCSVFGWQGVALAHAFTYAGYWLFLFVVVRRYMDSLARQRSERDLA